ncbi:MAG TPA: hypothetical protein VGL40_11715 [Bacillota bacterium]|jgi:hypothetical protein
MAGKKYSRARGFENITTSGNLTQASVGSNTAQGNLGANQNLGGFDRFDLNRFQFEVANEIGLDAQRPSRQKVQKLESTVHNEGGATGGTGTGKTGTTTRTATGAGTGGVSGGTKKS